ncbi:MAG: LytTR family DNA-binding domain-containing protein [Bacteroidota bacterium]
MKIILIEDEKLALNKIKRLLSSLGEDFRILAEISSVEEGFQFLESSSFRDADLIFSDIQLSDGLSFQIFEKHPTDTPIVFTTAYDQYALKAIRVSGIDYLLKPFAKEDLKAAVEKYKSFKKRLSHQQESILELLDHFQKSSTEFPNFISYFKNQIIPISSKDVSCFFIKDQLSFALHASQKSPLNETLDAIERRLPKRHFFRANRQHIIRREYIQNIENYFNGKLLVKMESVLIPSVIVSKEKSSLFKKWLEL